MSKKTRNFSLGFVIILFYFSVFAQQVTEEVTITAYYPSPYGSYNELTVSGRMAIGDTNGDGKVDSNDLPVYDNPVAPYIPSWFAGDPIPGSLAVANRLVVGRKIPYYNSTLHVHNSVTNPVDKAGLLTLSDVTQGWNSQIVWLDSSAKLIHHTLFQDTRYNNQLCLVLNYGGIGGNGTNSETFSVFANTQDPYSRGALAIATLNAAGYNLYVNGTAYSTGGWSSSDARLKKNIQNITGALEKIKNINAVTFDWRTDEFPNKGLRKGRQIGIIAQEVEKKFPELINTDNEGYETLAYERFTSVLLAAVKEQQKEIETLKRKIEALEAKK